MTVTAPPRPDHQDELDALIEEARRRARRRRARNALVALAVAGGGLYAAFGHGGGGSGADGRSLSGGAAGRPGASAAGQQFADAPHSQRFSEFGRCPQAPPSRYLPARAGCLSVRRADVDGDGRTDLVLLYARLDSRGFPRSRRHGDSDRFTLEVVRARGGVATTAVPRSDLNTTFLRARNLDGRPGIELLVHEYHVTTTEGLGVYTFERGALRRPRGFVFDGSDAGLAFGVTCRRGAPATIIQHDFAERIPFREIWDRTDTTYRWAGARLRREGVQRVKAPPTGNQIGLHC